MPTHAEVIEQLVARAERAEADLRKAAKALALYGRHEWLCAFYDPERPDLCSCGYRDALLHAQAAAARVRS